MQRPCQAVQDKVQAWGIPHRGACLLSMHAAIAQSDVSVNRTGRERFVWIRRALLGGSNLASVGGLNGLSPGMLMARAMTPLPSSGGTGHSFIFFGVCLGELGKALNVCRILKPAHWQPIKYLVCRI